MAAARDDYDVFDGVAPWLLKYKTYVIYRPQTSNSSTYLK